METITTVTKVTAEGQPKEEHGAEREEAEAEDGEDIVTQLQTNLHQLATQFYASVRYLSTHHPLLDYDGIPLNVLTNQSLLQIEQRPQTPPQPTTSLPTTNDTETIIIAAPTTITTTATAGLDKKSSKKDKRENPLPKDDADAQDQNSKPPLSPDWNPLDPDPFAQDMAELAGDLITKQTQIEDLLNLLPRDLALEEHRQELKIRELIRELEALEAVVGEARMERDRLLGRVEGVIERVGRRGGW